LSPGALVRLALLGEGLLVVVAFVWISWRELPLAWGGAVEGLIVGCGAAGVLGAANLYLLRWAPELPGVRSVRQLYRDALLPLFGRVTGTQIAIISLAAGAGEELLFRGAVQPELGLIPASVIFGLLHMGGRGTLAFGCWAMVMGAALGGLAIWTGGLLAPIVAHAVYDAAAMSYIRWGRWSTGVGRD
jgi:hypothetical protein